jgi:U3 small nucleolar RNA-associated protein 16
MQNKPNYGIILIRTSRILTHSNNAIRDEQLKKEKRKERDQRLKSQAVSKKSKELPNGGKSQTRGPEQDDMMSESTATLQDLGFKDPRLLGSLPALLPDEILNAEPVARLPTPVSENDKSKPRISQKRKFLDEEQKPPKDVRRGGTTIRVLDGSSGTKNALAPTVSKAGKHVRENWMSGNRSGMNTTGLRRTTGGSKGFVRKG